MARVSFESRVRKLVKDNGWELEIEGDFTGPDTLIWVYSNNAHQWLEEPHKHSECAHTEDNETVPQTWRELLDRLEEFGSCDPDCQCYS